MSIRRIADRAFDRGHALPAATGPAGTAHGPAVDLKPRAGATTGGYLVIDQPQADTIMNELEREQAINPITMERPELRASIFRVEARTPKPNGDPRYSYWDPAELWRWLQQPERRGRMPDTNEPAWFEDWWALYYTYGAPAVPSWAYSLEKRNPNTQPSASVREAGPEVPPDVARARAATPRARRGRSGAPARAASLRARTRAWSASARSAFAAAADKDPSLLPAPMRLRRGATQRPTTSPPPTGVCKRFPTATPRAPPFAPPSSVERLRRETTSPAAAAAASPTTTSPTLPTSRRHRPWGGVRPYPKMGRLGGGARSATRRRSGGPWRA